jgi:hypothetical protein
VREITVTASHRGHARTRHRTLVVSIVAALGMTVASPAPHARAAVADACTILSPATIKILLGGNKPDGTPTKNDTGRCGWHAGTGPVPIAGASITYTVFPSEAAAKKQYQTYASSSTAKKVTGVGDEAVVKDLPGLSSLTARKGSLYLHLEEGGKGTTSKPLPDIAKKIFATGHG